MKVVKIFFCLYALCFSMSCFAGEPRYIFKFSGEVGQAKFFVNGFDVTASIGQSIDFFLKPGKNIFRLKKGAGFSDGIVRLEQHEKVKNGGKNIEISDTTKVSNKAVVFDFTESSFQSKWITAKTFKTLTQKEEEELAAITKKNIETYAAPTFKSMKQELETHSLLMITEMIALEKDADATVDKMIGFAAMWHSELYMPEKIKSATKYRKLKVSISPDNPALINVTPIGTDYLLFIKSKLSDEDNNFDVGIKRLQFVYVDKWHLFSP